MNPNDLRVVKTKKNIEEALLHLLAKKELDKIQVMDICKKAACSRNTFYAHYYNKYELFSSICINCVDKICESFSLEHFSQEYVDLYGYGTEIVYASKQYQEKLAILLKSGYASEIKEQLRMKLYEMERDSYLSRYHVCEIPTDISLGYHYQVGGVVEFICNLSIGYNNFSTEEAAKLHSTLNTPVANVINEMVKYGEGMYMI